jgi:hypothetical protein
MVPQEERSLAEKAVVTTAAALIAVEVIATTIS